MFKRTLVFTLAAALVLVGLTSLAPAAQNVANTSQKGSLLVFPKIDTSYDESGYSSRDTIVMIANDYFQEVWIKCYWMNSDQEIQDFMFRLTPNQPVWIRASDGYGTGYYDAVSYPITVPAFFGGAGEVGELKCWAVNPAGNEQISWNHLYGNAVVFDVFEGSAYEYNAWSFTARGVAQGATVGTGGELILSGANGAYDACPQYALVNFFATGASIYWGDLQQPDAEVVIESTDLTVTPCIQDLRQDRNPTCTKLKYDIWNENEIKYTGAYQCIKCWYEGYLEPDLVIGSPTPQYGYEKFLYQNLHTTAGRFRVSGIPSTACRTYAYGKCSYSNMVYTPVLALTATELQIYAGEGGVKEALAGTTSHGAGADSRGKILWDIQGDHPESPPSR